MDGQVKRFILELYTTYIQERSLSTSIVLKNYNEKKKSWTKMTLISERIDRKKLICTIINSSITCEYNSIPYKERNFVWKIAISSACISKFGMTKFLGCLCLTVGS